MLHKGERINTNHWGQRREKQQFASPDNGIILGFCPESCEISRFLIGRTNVSWEDVHSGKLNVLEITKLWKSVCPLKLENIPFLDGELVGVHLNSGVSEKLHYLGCDKNTAFSNCWNTICYQLYMLLIYPLSSCYPPPTSLKHMKYCIFILWTSCSPSSGIERNLWQCLIKEKNELVKIPPGSWPSGEKKAERKAGSRSVAHVHFCSLGNGNGWPFVPQKLHSLVIYQSSHKLYIVM